MLSKLVGLPIFSYFYFSFVAAALAALPPKANKRRRRRAGGDAEKARRMRRLDPETYTWPEIEVLSGASLVHAWLRGDGGFLSSLLPLFVLFYFYIYGYKNDETSSRAPAGGKLLARSDESCEGGEKGAGEDLRTGATFVFRLRGGKEQRYCANSLCQSPWPLARPMRIVNSKFYNLGLHVLLYSFRQRIMCLSTTLLPGVSRCGVLVRGAGMNSDAFTRFRKEA